MLEHLHIPLRQSIFNKNILGVYQGNMLIILKLIFEEVLLIARQPFASLRQYKRESIEYRSAYHKVYTLKKITHTC